ncbi:MAG TPA: hypothetical protein VJK29_20785 [Terriglobales bacterium]|nr:hypothetical protein [Terriglobales bacterium]
MELERRKQMAKLLRDAACQAISEGDFWQQFKPLVGDLSDPAAGLAYESAVHYWGNFHQRNLLLIKTKPDRHQLKQGQMELNLIADALDSDWPVEQLRAKLNDI